MLIEPETIKGKWVIFDGNLISSLAEFIGGPIDIGSNNVFYDRVKIINNTQETMKIGSNNQFHCDCIVSASNIGDYNEFRVKSVVGNGTIVPNRCIIGNGVVIPPESYLQENRTYYGSNRSRKSPFYQNIHEKHLEFLLKTIPKYHSVQYMD